MSDKWRFVVLSVGSTQSLRPGDVVVVNYDGYRATVEGWAGPRGLNFEPAWAVAALARDLGVIPREIVPPGELIYEEARSGRGTPDQLGLADV